MTWERRERGRAELLSTPLPPCMPPIQTSTEKGHPRQPCLSPLSEKEAWRQWHGKCGVVCGQVCWDEDLWMLLPAAGMLDGCMCMCMPATRRATGSDNTMPTVLGHVCFHAYTRTWQKSWHHKNNVIICPPHCACLCACLHIPLIMLCVRHLWAWHGL